jgi:cyclin A
MEHQSDINSAMRTILVDWLIEVADEYKIIDDTLFLCIQYIDRFLSTVNVTRAKLQLLG